VFSAADRPIEGDVERQVLEGRLEQVRGYNLFERGDDPVKQLMWGEKVSVYIG